MQLRVGGKQDDWEEWIRFQYVFSFYDVPSFISGDSIAFLDPQEKFLRQRGIIGLFPTNGVEGLSEKDHLVPFEGIEGINYRSNFEETLFRIPFRREASKISDRTFSITEILELFFNLKSTILSQLLYLCCLISHNQLKQKLDFAIGAQQDPEDSQLQQYAQRFRLRVLDGVARPLENSKARCSDRAMLLIENNKMPDLDQLKLSWISSSISIQKTSKVRNLIRFQVLKYMLQTETILFNDNSEEDETLFFQFKCEDFKEDYRFIRPNNSVLLGGNRNTDVFLHSGILEHAESFSSIVFNNKVNEIALINHLYKILTWKTSEEYQFFRLLKVILPKYRDVAWSKKYLIAEDIIPPPQVLQKLSSFGKPNVSNI
ncbi:11993_t:CDS:2, partial [Funneliformis caledonium]